MKASGTQQTWLVACDRTVKVSGTPVDLAYGDMKRIICDDWTVKASGEVAQPTSHSGLCRSNLVHGSPGDCRPEEACCTRGRFFNPQGCETLREFRV